MSNYKEVYLYTLRDLKKRYDLEASLFDDDFGFKLIQMMGFKGVCFVGGDALTLIESIFSMAYLRFENWYIYREDTELKNITPTEATLESSDKWYEIARKLKLWYQATYNNYSKVLEEYTALKNKLITDIESTSHIGGTHNDYDDDTPQTKVSDSNTIFDKNHASYYRYGDTDTDTKTNVNNLYNIEKLEMLNNKIFDIENEWATTLKDYLICARYDEYDEE